MSQDTRKDKRAKVVSLNVRYKSATVDEFIENHSHDVSKGGIFVKTPTPFPAGTLLKFEIRLAGDKSVISGVGRVVWKREPTQASSDKPAGMGVKFIKIDDASRAVIDRLVAQKADAGSAYTSDPAAHDDESGKPGAPPTTLRGIPAATPAGGTAAPTASTPIVAPAPTPGGGSKAPPAAASSSPAAAKLGSKTIAQGSAVAQGSGVADLPASKPVVPGARSGGPPPPMAHRPATAIGMGPPPAGLPPAGSPPATTPASGTSRVAPAAKSEPRVGAPAPPPPARSAANPRKATMIGVGLPAAASAPGADKHELPTLNSEIAPVGLGGVASGSMKPAASTPTPTAVSPSTPPAPAAVAKSSTGPMFPKDAAPYEPGPEPTMMKQAAELLEEALREAGGSLDEIGQNPLFSQSSQRGDKVEESKPSQPVAQQSGQTVAMKSPVAKAPAASPASVDSPAAAAPVAAAATSTPPPSKAEPAKPIGQTLAQDEKKGGGGLIAGLLVAAVVVIGGAAYAYKSGLLGAGAQDNPVPSAAPTPAPLPSASASANVASDSGATTVTDAGGAAALAASTDAAAHVAASDASASASAAAGASAATATTATQTAKPTPQPPPVARPAAPRAPAAPRPVPAPTATDPDFQPPAPTSTPESAPTSTSTAAPATTSTSTAAPTATSTSTAAPEL